MHGSTIKWSPGKENKSIPLVGGMGEASPLRTKLNFKSAAGHHTSNGLT